MTDFDREIERRGSDCVKWDSPPGPPAAGREAPIPLWVADADFASAEPILEAIRLRAAHPVFGYGTTPDSFLDAFRDWTRARHGLELERESLRFTPGVVTGLALAVRSLTDPGDGIVIQPPVYHPFARIIAANGRRVVENPLREEGGRWTMDFEGLERAADAGARALLLCSPHNPTGRCWTADELGRLAETCATRDMLLVSDEIHSDIVFGPSRHVPAASLGRATRERLVAFHAPSKTWNVAGLQTSLAFIPDPRLRAAFDAERGRLGLESPNVFGMVAARAAYSSGGPWLEDFLGYVRGNFGYLESRLGACRGGLSASPLEATYLAWIDFRRAGIDGPLHDFLLREAGLWLDDGLRFGTGGAGWARLNLATTRARLALALDRLEAALAARVPRA